MASGELFVHLQEQDRSNATVNLSQNMHRSKTCHGKHARTRDLNICMTEKTSSRTRFFKRDQCHLILEKRKSVCNGAKLVVVDLELGVAMSISRRRMLHLLLAH